MLLQFDLVKETEKGSRLSCITGSSSNQDGSNSSVICRCHSNGSGSWQKDVQNSAANVDSDVDSSSSPDPEELAKLEQQMYEQLAFNLARLLLLQQVQDTSLQQFPVARLQQIVRVDHNESPSSAVGEVDQSTSGSSHTLSNAIKAVLRFPLRTVKSVTQHRFDDIRQSEIESYVINKLPLFKIQFYDYNFDRVTQRI
jgi:hypothetical protein